MTPDAASTAIAYIGLGGNLGDAAGTLRQAAEILAALPDCSLLGASQLYRNPPLGPANQPDYHNAVLKLATTLSPWRLLDELQRIEARFGRVRGAERWGPRTLDLDLLLHGETVCRTERLTLPHPGLRDRAFVLYPLHEIDPDLVLPGNERLADLLERVSAEGLERVGTLLKMKHE
ncbi:MAG: 2-amino-4-hydroxy-6-hydroxymethyldihydropteridine diphosphokinase [Gammaproteobacteria bacterium]